MTVTAATPQFQYLQAFEPCRPLGLRMLRTTRTRLLVDVGLHVGDQHIFKHIACQGPLPIKEDLSTSFVVQSVFDATQCKAALPRELT